MFSSPRTPGAFPPGVTFQPEEGRREDSLSSTSEDSEKDEKDEDHERERFYIYRKPSWVAFLFEDPYVGLQSLELSLTLYI